MAHESGRDPSPLWRRCFIHATKMWNEGWYTTGNVLLKASEALRAAEIREANLRQEASFLLDRLSEFSCDLRDGQGRDWYGHVDPSIERLKGLIKADPNHG